MSKFGPDALSKACRHTEPHWKHTKEHVHHHAEEAHRMSGRERQPSQQSLRNSVWVLSTFADDRVQPDGRRTSSDRSSTHGYRTRVGATGNDDESTTVNESEETDDVWDVEEDEEVSPNQSGAQGPAEGMTVPQSMQGLNTGWRGSKYRTPCRQLRVACSIAGH